MKRIVMLILTLVVVLSTLSACGSSNTVQETETTPPETTHPFDLDSYKSDVSACVNRLYLNAAYLLNVANYEASYWEASNTMGVAVTAEDLLSYGAEKFNEQIGEDFQVLSANYDDITATYKDIISISIDGDEAAEIKAEFKEYFELYVSVYNLAMSPSGELESYKETLDEYFNAVKNTQSIMEVLLS